MQRKFDIFFKIKFLHEYYKDEVCQDFTIEPTSRCLKILKDNKLVFKPSGNGGAVFYEINANTRVPLFPINMSVGFTFILKCNNKLFSQFTDYSTLPVLEGAPSYFLYYEKVNQELRARAMAFKPAIFKYDFKTNASSVQLQITNSNGHIIFDKLIDRNTGPDSDKLLTTYQFDLQGHPDGLFTIKESGAGVASKVSDVYISKDTLSRNLFGVVEVNGFDQPTLDSFYAAYPTLKFRFRVPEKTWKYYLVVKESDWNSYTYMVEDKGANPISFSPKAVDDEHKQLLETNNNKALLFISDKILVREEIRKIKLSKKRKPNGETIPIIENLPNPALNNMRSEIILNV